MMMEAAADAFDHKVREEVNEHHEFNDHVDREEFNERRQPRQDSLLNQRHNRVSESLLRDLLEAHLEPSYDCLQVIHDVD